VKPTQALITAAALFAVGSLAHAQAQAPSAEAKREAATRLSTGMWAATITPPGGTSQDAQMEIATTKDSATITIHGGGNQWPASAVRFENGALRFSWAPGPTVECALKPQSAGGFSGDCSDGSGGTGTITITPPKKS
jgi:hypothetical protein